MDNQIGLALVQTFERTRDSLVVEMKTGTRMIREKTGEGCEDPRTRAKVPQHHTQDRFLAGCKLTCKRIEMMEIAQGNRGSFMKSASVLRQFDPIAAAIKEFETQACLKPRHGRENGRVRPVEGIASGLETA